MNVHRRKVVLRQQMVVASMLALLLVLAACAQGDQADSAEESTSSETEDTGEDQSETEDTGEDQAESPPTPEGDESLTMWTSQEFEAVFHPVQSCCAQDFLLYMIYNRLVSVEPDAVTLEPDLASSWTASDDATTYTFELRDDVVWQDGEPFTIEDVIWTIEWTVQNFEAFGAFAPQWTDLDGVDEFQSGEADEIAGIEVLDDSTLQLTLASPNAEFLRNLADAANSILPRHLLEDTSASTIRQESFVTSEPIGTGPFQVVDVVPDQHVELEAHAGYFEGSPSIDQVFFMLYGADTAMASLETGDLDLAFQIDPREFERMQAVDGLVGASVQTPGIVRMELKNEEPPFDDVRARQAVYSAVDRREICEQVLDGLCTVLHVNPGFMQFDGLDEFPHDPDRASQLLDEAGYDGEVVRIMWDQGVSAYNTIFPIVGQQMEEVGFEVELMPTETSVFIDWLRFERDRWEIAVNTGGTELLSPDRSAVYFDCEYEGERGKWQTGYENCEMDALFREGRETADPAERNSIYQQIAEILNEDVPAVNLWSPHVVYAHSAGLGGTFEASPVVHQTVLNIEGWTLD